MTYATAFTINTSVDLTSYIQKGDKLLMTNSGTKYFYVISITSSLITVTGGADYAVANAAITAPYFSKAENPQGFPQTFSLGTPTWTASLVNFTNQPGNNACFFWIIGNICYVRILASTHATSGGTGQFIATFTTGYLPNVGDSSGNAFNLSAPKGGYSYTQAGNNHKVYIVGYDGLAIATNSAYFEAVASYRF